MIARLALLLLTLTGRLSGELVRNPDVLQHGEIGCGKLVVLVSGSVEKPGVHFLPEGATLADLIEAAGKGVPCNQCQKVPKAVSIHRVGERSARKLIRISSPELVNGFRLEDRDIVTFVTAHF